MLFLSPLALFSSIISLYRNEQPVQPSDSRAMLYTTGLGFCAFPLLLVICSLTGQAQPSTGASDCAGF